MQPRLSILLGDRNGIGPELCARLLADEQATAGAAIEVIGDPAVLAEGERAAGVSLGRGGFAFIEFMPVPGIATTPARVTAEAGRECLAALSFAARRVLAGEADGFVFAPLNKAAMHLGGLKHEDELRYLADEIGFRGTVGELNVLDRLWTTRVTSHIPIKQVAARITVAAVLGSTRFAHEILRQAGKFRPRVAVAALNPHAGDGGNFGREEIDVIEPAVAAAQAEGIAAEGPFPADTVFVRAQAGDFDCVVTMYHDQGQIAMKLLGFGRGVTVLGGLPVPVATCGHGTGYDIAGQGKALPDALKNAFAICRSMATSRSGRGRSAGMTAASTPVGFIGLGLMGQAFTRRLCACGHVVTGFDIDPGKLETAARHGVVPAGSAAEVAAASDLVLLCVTGTAAVEAAVFGRGGIAEAATAEKILIDHSTTELPATREMAARLAGATSMAWIDAPVSGGPPAAAAGTLAIMAGGEAAAIERVRPLMAQMSAAFTHMGPLGAGQATKMVNQVLVLNGYCLLAEALALAEAAGVDAAMIPQALAPGHAGSNLLQAIFPRMVARDFAPAGYARQVLKDLDMVHDLAKALQVPTPMSSQAASLYRMLVAKGGAERDGIAVLTLYEPANDR